MQLCTSGCFMRARVPITPTNEHIHYTILCLTIVIGCPICFFSCSYEKIALIFLVSKNWITIGNCFSVFMLLPYYRLTYHLFLRSANQLKSKKNIPQTKQLGLFHWSIIWGASILCTDIFSVTYFFRLNKPKQINSFFNLFNLNQKEDIILFSYDKNKMFLENMCKHIS